MAPPPRAGELPLEALAAFLDACEEAAAAIRALLAAYPEEMEEARRRVDIAVEAVRRARERLDEMELKQASRPE